MRPALVLTAAVVLATAATADSRELRAPARRAVRLSIDRAEPGIGRCTSDGACTFTRCDGTTVRAAGVLGPTGNAPAPRRAKARPAATPTA
jgi:hypothetical protein